MRLLPGRVLAHGEPRQSGYRIGVDGGLVGGGEPDFEL